jgi:hypothetical protein
MSEHFRVPGKHSGGANQTVELRGHELKGYCTIFHETYVLHIVLEVVV